MQLVECPRDAMQGINDFIPTEAKIKYLNKLLKVGFDTLDFGSFVSPKAIPQLRDTKEVLQDLEVANSSTKLLAIVANTRGAMEALMHTEINYLGYPLSISETFQQRNTNKSIAIGLEDVSRLNELCHKDGKKLVTYISMGFGNPYGDPYSVEYLVQFVDILTTLGVDIISLSDTIGVATSVQIKSIYSLFSTTYPEINFGVHLHSNPESAADKVRAALDAGCERIDSAILGYGGCPMAEDELVGNMNTRTVLEEIQKHSTSTIKLDIEAFKDAEQFAAKEIFGKYQ